MHLLQLPHRRRRSPGKLAVSSAWLEKAGLDQVVLQRLDLRARHALPQRCATLLGLAAEAGARRHQVATDARPAAAKITEELLDDVALRLGAGNLIIAKAQEAIHRPVDAALLIARLAAARR
jgi:hypothetical protein